MDTDNHGIKCIAGDPYPVFLGAFEEFGRSGVANLYRPAYFRHNLKNLRQGGQWKGKVKIAPDFDELPDSFMATFRTEKV